MDIQAAIVLLSVPRGPNRLSAPGILNYCSTWSLWYLESRGANPNMSAEEVVAGMNAHLSALGPQNVRPALESYAQNIHGILLEENPKFRRLFVDVDDGAETTPADDHPDTLYQDFIASAPKAGMDSFSRKSPSRMGWTASPANHPPEWDCSHASPGLSRSTMARRRGAAGDAKGTGRACTHRSAKKAHK
jgi:hypothetical protein